MLSKKIKIVIADDHRIFREGLKLMLAGVSNIDLLGEAADGNQLIALVASTAPDVIITDVKMPNLTGTEAVKYYAQNIRVSELLRSRLLVKTNKLLK